MMLSCECVIITIVVVVILLAIYNTERVQKFNRKRRKVGTVFNPCSHWPATCHIEGQH